MRFSRDHEHCRNLMWCLRGTPSAPAIEQLASTHDSQHAGLLVEMMLRAKRLNEPKSAHHRDLGCARELGRVAIFVPRCTREMGRNPSSEEYFHEPLIDVSEQAHAVTSRARWFTHPLGSRV